MLSFILYQKKRKIARENAKLAGVDHLIHFQTRAVKDLSHPKKYGFIITNPPYGERLEEKVDLPPIYEALGERYKALDSWSMYLITSYENAERDLGKKADKNRKIYNQDGENLLKYLADDCFFDGFHLYPGNNDIEVINYNVNAEISVDCRYANRYSEAVYI